MGNEFPFSENKQEWKKWGSILVIVLLEFVLLTLALGWVKVPNPFLATLVATGLVLVLPGWLILSLVSKEMIWIQKTGVAPVISLGLWSVPFFILLSTNSTTFKMLILIVSTNILLGGLFVVHKMRKKDYTHTKFPPSDSDKIIWTKTSAVINFCLFVIAVLFLLGLYAATVNIAHTDRRNYERYSRSYLESDGFGTDIYTVSEDTPLPPRGKWNIWNLLVAASARLTQHEFFDIYNFYLPVVLILLACISSYAIAYELFKDANSAWFAASLWLVYLSSGVFYIFQVGYGFKWLFRVHEDKFALWFIVLPGALAITWRFLGSQKNSWIVIIGFCILGIVAIHPLGLLFYGMVFCGYMIFESVFFIKRVIANKGSGQSLYSQITSYTFFQKTLVILLFLSLTLVFTVMQRQMQMENFSQLELTSNFFAVTNDMPQSFLLASANNNSYSVDPSILSNPFIIASLVSLFWLLVRSVKSKTARLLSANMIIPIIFVFSPVRFLIARLITAHLLWRLLWVLPVTLVLTFIVSDVIRWLQNKQFQRLNRSWASLLFPFTIGCTVILFHVQMIDATKTLWEMHHSGTPTPSSVTVNELALLNFMRNHVQTDSTIFADEEINNNIPSLVGIAYGVTYLGTPPRLSRTPADLDYFYSQQFITSKHLEILELYDAEYLVLPKDNPLYLQFAALKSIFGEIYQNEEYGLFQIYNEEYSKIILNHLITANNLMGNESIDEAIPEYKTVLGFDHDNFWVLTQLGDIYRNQGDKDLATKFYESATQIRPFYDTNIKLGDMYALQGFTSKAKSQYTNSLALNQNDFSAQERIYWLQMRLALTNNNIELAIKNLQNALQLNQCNPLPTQPSNERYLPPNWPIVFNPPTITRSSWIQKCLAQSQTVAIDNIDVTDTHEISMLLADLYKSHLNNATEKELDIYEKIISTDSDGWSFLHPYMVKTYLELGKMKSNQQDQITSIKYFHRAIQLISCLPNHINYLNEIISISQKQSYDTELFTSAAVCYEKMLEIDPENEQVYQELAEVYRIMGDLKKSKSLYSKLADFQPNNAQVHMHLGTLNELSGNFDASATAYQTAIKLDPTLVAGYVQLSNLYQTQNKTEEAIEVFHEAVKNNANMAWPHLQTGQLYLQLVKAD